MYWKKMWTALRPIQDGYRCAKMVSRYDIQNPHHFLRLDTGRKKGQAWGSEPDPEWDTASHLTVKIGKDAFRDGEHLRCVSIVTWKIFLCLAAELGDAA
jgi:hypothetical protein